MSASGMLIAFILAVLRRALPYANTPSTNQGQRGRVGESNTECSIIAVELQELVECKQTSDPSYHPHTNYYRPNFLFGQLNIIMQCAAGPENLSPRIN